MPLTVVTCTGGRPELFALCRKWVLRQTVQPARWIVTTDYGDQPFAPEADVLAIPESYEMPPTTSPSAALRAISFAIQQAGDGTDVVVMEDDDWYGPDYIKNVLSTKHWCSHQGSMYQFHLPSQRMHYGRYAEPVEGMLAYKAGNQARILKWLTDRKEGEKLDSEPIAMRQLAQIKGVGFGLPGRTGATRKHITAHRKVQIMGPDPKWRTFRSFVGADAESYLTLLR